MDALIAKTRKERNANPGRNADSGVIRKCLDVYRAY